MDLDSVFYRKKSQNSPQELKESTFKPDKLFSPNPSEPLSAATSSNGHQEHVILNFSKDRLNTADESVSISRSFEKRGLFAQEPSEQPGDNDEDDHFRDASVGAFMRGDFRKSLHRKSIRKHSHKNLSDKSELISDTSSVAPQKNNTENIIHKFGQKFIVLHYSPFKAVWDWIVVLLVVYTAIATPYTAAFLLNEDEKHAKLNVNAATRLFNSEISGAHPLVIIDLIVDLMFLIDILLSFRTTFVSKDGEVISDPMNIAKAYFKGWFFIDAFSAMPLDLLIFGSGNIDTLKITGLLKIIRLLRLARVVKTLEQFSEFGLAVLLALMAVFGIVGHWLACVFYAIACIERPTIPEPRYTWLDHLAEKYNMPYEESDYNSGPDLNSKYITSLFFSLTTLTSVGFGNVAPTTIGEKIFSIIAMMLGALLSAAIFGNVTTIMMKMYQGTEELKEMRNSVNDFIKFHQIPKSLSKRMNECFDHTWSCTNGIDMNQILRGFPESLQADICLHLNRQLFNTCIAFKDADIGCLRILALKFNSIHIPPGDTLIHKGDNLNAIYFIAHGTLEILKNYSVMAILDKNDIFGENLSKYEEEDIMGRSNCDVRALTNCDLHKIERRDLLEVLSIYPSFAKTFKQNFQVTFDLRECEITENGMNASTKRRKSVNPKGSSASLVSPSKSDTSSPFSNNGLTSVSTSVTKNNVSSMLSKVIREKTPSIDLSNQLNMSYSGVNKIRSRKNSGKNGSVSSDLEDREFKDVDVEIKELAEKLNLVEKKLRTQVGDLKTLLFDLLPANERDFGVQSDVIDDQIEIVKETQLL